MRFAMAIFVATAALSAASCSSTSVHSDFDHHADFGSYSTFAWHTPGTTDSRPTTGANQIVDGRIRRAVAETLSAKGYAQAAPDSADLNVTYYTSMNSHLRVYATGWGYGWGGGPYWGYGYSCWPGWSSVGATTYHEGTIIVDVIDRDKNQLVWRGVITSSLSKKSSSEEKINAAITRVLSDFPAR